MSGLLFAVAAASTVPAAALGWAAARIAEPLLKAPAPRSRMWSGALGLTGLTGAFAVLWPMPKPAPLDIAPVVTQVASRIAAPVAAPPIWRFDITPWVEGVLTVILVGVALNLILLGVRLLQARRLVAQARPFDDTAIQADLGRHADRIGVGAPLLLVSETAKTAMLVGFWPPVVVLPSALAKQTDREALGLICAHELVHLKRRDHWRALVDRLVAAALWFNPFALAIVSRQVAVREELCDLAVLSAASAHQRRLYAATLVEALRLAGRQSLHPSLIRRKGGGHAMRLKAILHPAAKPRPVALFAAGGLVALAAATSLCAGVAMAQAADSAAGERPSASAKSDAATYLISMKIYDGEKLLASPRLMMKEDGEATVESADPGYKIRTSIKQIDKQYDAFPVQATLKRDGVESVIAWPRMTLKRGGSASMNIPSKISLTISPIEMKTALGPHPIQPAGWGSDVTADKVTRNAGLTLYEGHPTLKLEGQPPAPITIDNRSASVAEVNALPVGSISRIELRHSRDESQSPRSAIKSIDVTTNGNISKALPAGSIDIVADETNQNRATGLTSWSGTPSVKVNGSLPSGMSVTVDGKPTPPGFDLQSIPSSKIARIDMTFPTETEKASGATPRPRAINIITKPE